MTRRQRAFRLFSVLTSFLLVTCAPDYKDLSTANGRQAILDQADDFLTAGNCESAINLLEPLVHSQYNNNDVLMKFASAFACRGGLNFPNLIGNLKDLGGQDLWSVLIRTNHSTGSSDGKVTALDTAIGHVLQTAVPAGHLAASQRTADANTFMVFLEMNVIATTIAPLGNASSATGKKLNSITGLGTTNDKCHVQVAFAQVTDSLSYVSVGSAIGTIVTNVNSVCASALGGACPTNHDLTLCLNDVVMQAQGQLLINAIDTIWLQ